MACAEEKNAFFELPTKLVLAILKDCTYQDCYKVRATCKALKSLIEDNLKSLASQDVYHIDLERRRVRAWRNFSWCDRIPFRSIEYISKFFCYVNVKVLTVFTASHESICQLLKAAKCRVINFEAVESHLQPAHFEFEEYKNLKSLCFEMDDTIGEEFFASILDKCTAKDLIFHGCDRLPQRFVRTMFEKWLNGSRELEAVRITANQNFSFDEIISNLNIQNVDRSTWTMQNVKGDKATITMRRNNFHFFVAFEVNDHRVEDILYKIPYIE